VNHPFRLALPLLLTLPVHGLTVQGFNPTEHNRFTGFPTAPVMNPGFLYDASKFTGVGWWIWTSGTFGTIYAPITAVSPRHLLCASHSVPSGGTLVHFIDSTGALLQRAAQSAVAVPNDAAGNSDLCVVTLASPLPPTVAHLPWLNLAGGEESYLGKELIVLGQTPNGTPRGGRAVTADFDGEDGQLAGTHNITWLFDSTSSPANDSALTPGDSGGPSFGMAGSQPALVGVHSAIATEGTVTESYDSFVPRYATRVDAILAPAGHRLIPAHFTPTTLEIPAATPGSLRRFNPGQVGFTIANSGGELTGNLAVTISFPTGHQPDSMSAPGWVVEPAGIGTWNLRAATLAAGANLAFTANWTALPDLASISASLSADSDTATAVTANLSFPLGPSFAEWADGLAAPGQGDDPDGDGLENLLEYALGGDPESGALTLPGGHPLLPVISHQGGTVSLTYPERDDALLRGISYLVESSTSPAALAGATTLPAGAASTTAPFSPPLPGFVKRTVTWPADGPRRFARVKVELAE
jgi:hypothetical protein